MSRNRSILSTNRLLADWIEYLLKKTWQTATIDKDDSTLSVAYSFLKIKSKAYIFKNVFKIPWNMQWARICLGIGILIVLNFWSGRKNHARKKVSTWYSDFAFHVGNHVGICRMATWVRKTVFFARSTHMDTRQEALPPTTSGAATSSSPGSKS